jgi:hypothetical protein
MKTSHLLLYCDATHARFTLAREGETWRKEFSDLKAAFACASELVDRDTPITIFNEVGKVIIESTVTSTRSS